MSSQELRENSWPSINNKLKENNSQQFSKHRCKKRRNKFQQQMVLSPQIFARSISTEYKDSRERDPKDFNLVLSESVWLKEKVMASSVPEGSMVSTQEIQAEASSGSTRARRLRMSPCSRFIFKHSMSMLVFMPTTSASSCSHWIT